jgi:hypothetical protein
LKFTIFRIEKNRVPENNKNMSDPEINESIGQDKKKQQEVVETNFKSTKLLKDLKLTDSKTISKLFLDLQIYNIYGREDDIDSGTNKEQKLLAARKDQTNYETSTESSLNTNTCMVCSEIFEDLLEQRLHFKLDWHRYNLKLKLQGSPSISEDAFNILIENAPKDGINVFKRKDSEVPDDDAESLSGSESDFDIDECADSYDSNLNKDSNLVSEEALKLLRHPKIFVESQGSMFSMYKCILSPQREIAENDTNISGVTENDWLNSIYRLPNQLNWAILMLGGGHFAAAVFNGDKVVVHKTFHCYTVRRKQGGGQSGADNKSGTNHPKSAGASLRRYNEASLSQHVKDIIKTWNDDYLSKCHLIFYRAASSNKKILFGSVTGSSKDKPILYKEDPRVRSIPFPTRRATFKEVKRAHQLLLTIQRCRNMNVADENVGDNCYTRTPRIHAKDMKASQSKKSTRAIRRSKSRESPKRQLPEFVQMLADHTLSDSHSEDLSDKGDLRWVIEEHSTEGMMEYDTNTIQYDNTPVVKADRRKKKKANKKSLQSVLTDVGDTTNDDHEDDELSEIMNNLTTSCKIGNQKLLMETILALQDVIAANEENTGKHYHSINIQNVSDLLNKGFGDVTTALHIATQCGHKQVIEILLDHGSDPTIKDKQKKCPYNLAPDRETRNVFRRFQAKCPNKYNWADACIPTNDLLTPEEEARKEEKRKEKRRAQRQIKKEKDNLLKEQKAVIQKEEKDRESFLKLSDREKRALAAERRIIAAKNADSNSENSKSEATISGLTIQRCYQCGIDITGKVPFEYQNYRFCTTSCVKVHRKKCATNS